MSWDGTGVSVGTNTPFATFLAQVRREIEESTATVWSDASLLAWANDGMADIARRTRILSDWQSGSTVVGQASYALADGTFQVDKFFCGTGEIERVTGADYYADFSRSPVTGEAREYAIIGAYAYLYPTPATVKTYRYHRYYTPVAFTSATTTTTLPFVPSFDQTLRNYVKARAYDQIRDFDTSSYYQSLYEADIARINVRARYDELGNSVLLPQTAW